MDILSRFQWNKPPLCCLPWWLSQNTMSLFVLSLISPIRERDRDKQGEEQGLKKGERNKTVKKSEKHRLAIWIRAKAMEGVWDAERVKNGGLRYSLTKRDSVTERIKPTPSSTCFPVLSNPTHPHHTNSQRKSIIWLPAAGLSMSLHNTVTLKRKSNHKSS